MVSRELQRQHWSSRMGQSYWQELQYTPHYIQVQIWDSSVWLRNEATKIDEIDTEDKRTGARTEWKMTRRGKKVSKIIGEDRGMLKVKWTQRTQRRTVTIQFQRQGSVKCYKHHIPVANELVLNKSQVISSNLTDRVFQTHRIHGTMTIFSRRYFKDSVWYLWRRKDSSY